MRCIPMPTCTFRAARLPFPRATTPFTATADVTVADGVIEVLEAYEGIEGVDVVISGGEIGVVCSDDAINAAGGTEEEGTTAGCAERLGSVGGAAAKTSLR